MEKPTIGQRLGYWFDNMMARGMPAMIGMLFFISLIIILVVSAVVFLFKISPNNENFVELIWMGMMRTIDAGTVAEDEGKPIFLFLMLAITIGGIFIFSALIGVLSAGLDEQLERLRKGRSRVLGWS